MGRSITFVFEGDVNTRVRITENLDGTLSFVLEVLGPGTIGGLRALFFDLDHPWAEAAFTVYGDAGLSESACAEAGVDTLGRAARIDGGVVNALGDFDLGIEFGPPEKPRGDTRSTGFTLAHGGTALTLDMIDLANLGLRHLPEGTAATGGAAAAKAAGERAHGPLCKDALEVIDVQAFAVGPLAADTRAGVLAVI